jgi:biopolymer transport protein TolR
MALGKLERSASNQPVAEINMTPLIDVMLVLLVIFIIAAPLMTSSVKLELPKTENTSNVDAPEGTLVVSLKANGALFLKDSEISAASLATVFETAAKKNAQTELHIRADKKVPYGEVAKLMSTAQTKGLVRIGFITDPSTDKASR